MKEFLIHNFKYIILIVGGFLLSYLLIRTFSENKNNSKELQKKLDDIDIKVKELNTNLKNYNDSITKYKKDIQNLETSINNIKIQKKVVNNYYDDNATKIQTLTAKQVDSTLRKRYKY